MSSAERGRARHRKSGIDIFYVSIVCVLALLLVLVVSVIIMSFKIAALNKTVKDVNSELGTVSTALKNEVDAVSKRVEGYISGSEAVASGSDDRSAHSTHSNSEGPSPLGASSGGSWLDLSGHSEISVKPETFFDSFQTYYVDSENGVFIRSGPGTDYDKVTAANAGSKVSAAAATGEWTFVKYEGKFGWIKSDFLSATEPTF